MHTVCAPNNSLNRRKSRYAVFAPVSSGVEQIQNELRR